MSVHMASSSSTTIPPGGGTSRTRQFWHRVSEGMAIQQLWGQLQKDARSSYRLYSAGLENLEHQPSRSSRVWQMAKALFWAILEKLTPARRVLLLFGLIMLCLPTGGFEYKGRGNQVEFQTFDLHFWGGVLILAVLLLELADRVVMKRDLEIAKEIQNWLLPGAPLQLPGYQIAYATRPANTVAGDYYDVILRPGRDPNEGRILFVVADVAGKSIPAAMLMASFQASLRTLATSGISLGEIVAGLNRYGCSNSGGGARYTTAFLAELDPITGDFSYVNAGHNVPILRRKAGSVERLEAGGLPVGMFPDSPYQVARSRLESGDWLVIFTDGIVEAENAKQQEFGESEFIRLIDRCATQAPADLLRNLMVELDHFVGNTPQHDDMTCLLLKRT
jgi:phosphoserine phosphatase RsbU/P